MAATDLEGVSLGNKHHEYNKLLNEALENNDSKQLRDINFDEPDINNLLQIDIACHYKNIEYILKVLKSDDILYVCRALRKCTWLITDKQYENIIDPDFLQTKLYPEMSTKARIKLQKNIMHNLLDETRLEKFYEKEKCDRTAVKWLIGCSVPFIENKINKHSTHLNPKMLKRFSKKSVSIFKILSSSCLKKSLLNSTTFLINTHTDDYLEALESASIYDYPELNARATESVMQHASTRVINNFHIYANIINMQVFAKYIPKVNIKSFLFKLAQEHLDKNRNNLRIFFYSDKIFHIIKQMPKHEQFIFVKEVFITDVEINKKDKLLPLDSELHKMKALQNVVTLEQHRWYQFAPFEVAFHEIKKLISNTSSSKTINAMLMTLIYAANHDLQHIHTLLNYYKNNHKNHDDSTKRKFIDNLIDHKNINKFDSQTWSILIDLFMSIQVFEETGADDQKYVIAITLYNLIHNENVPEIIEKKLKFNTLKSHRKLLKEEEKEKVFNYLCNFLLKKINSQSISNESELIEAVELIKQYLLLLSDWNMEITDHPLIFIKIRDFIDIRQKQSWKIDLSSLYNVKKCWRKHMFEESLALCQSENVCLNALKHDPTLLDRHQYEMCNLRFNDKVSLQNFLNKLRIFWSRTFASEWINEYSERLGKLGSHKAVIKGLCGLLKQNQLLKIIKTYAPQQEKINWSEIDELTLSLQRSIAHNMHLARPQPSSEAVLLYAKGDYLSYALPSLLAIFYNMNLTCSRETLTKLLDTRVSLQKHVIRFTFLKLEHEEVKNIFSTVWKNTKNATIRCIIFDFTFKLLCDTKTDSNIESYEELLEMLIDNLTSEEDKKIYERFNDVQKIVNLPVRANILIKSYKLFQRLLSDTNKGTNSKTYKDLIETLATSSRDVMHLLPSKFSTELVGNYINEQFLMHNEYTRAGYGMVNVISAYILSAKDIKEQEERYEATIKPLIKRCKSLWNKMQEGNYYIRNKLQCLLSTLQMDLKIYMKMINFEIIYHLFFNIQSELESLTVSENYIMLTTWKLGVEMTKLLQDIDKNNEFIPISTRNASNFGKACVHYLKTDVKNYFSCIYILFVKALNIVLENLFTEKEKLNIYKSMLYDPDLIQAYLGVITMTPLPENIDDELKLEVTAIIKTLSTHPSVEVKMHYYNRFSDLKGIS